MKIGRFSSKVLPEDYPHGAYYVVGESGDGCYRITVTGIERIQGMILDEVHHAPDCRCRR